MHTRFGRVRCAGIDSTITLRALAETECQPHAYSLKTNQVHLLLTPKKATTMPRLNMSLGRCYVQDINRANNRTGTLRDSRYNSSVVQAN